MNMLSVRLFFILSFNWYAKVYGQENTPLVINTWNFTNAAAEGWRVVNDQNGSALDAVELGVRQCELDQCDGSVGWGNHPDESGEVSLDAMIMDGPTHDVGAVGALRRIKAAISVARKVLENTNHTLLVGSQATEFALEMGFSEESLSSNNSQNEWKSWKSNSCQPNFWKNVAPDSESSCGPYQPSTNSAIKLSIKRDIKEHDTIGMIVIDKQGRMAVGTSTNGANHKIPGRVGDSPIPGSGAYVDQEVGGAVGTGDGDVMMRFVPAYHAVERMRRGDSPEEAASDAIRRIARVYPHFSGAVVAANNHGEYGAACWNIGLFPFAVASPAFGGPSTEIVACLN